LGVRASGRRGARAWCERTSRATNRRIGGRARQQRPGDRQSRICARSATIGGDQGGLALPPGAGERRGGGRSSCFFRGSQMSDRAIASPPPPPPLLPAAPVPYPACLSTSIPLTTGRQLAERQGADERERKELHRRFSCVSNECGRGTCEGLLVVVSNHDEGLFAIQVVRSCAGIRFDVGCVGDVGAGGGGRRSKNASARVACRLVVTRLGLPRPAPPFRKKTLPTSLSPPPARPPVAAGGRLVIIRLGLPRPALRKKGISSPKISLAPLLPPVHPPAPRRRQRQAQRQRQRERRPQVLCHHQAGHGRLPLRAAVQDGERVHVQRSRDSVDQQ